VATYGQLDGYANVAGVVQQVGVRKRPKIVEENDQTWKQTLAVNLNGVM
jgi:chanoclavine-I dehydrogenase